MARAGGRILDSGEPFPSIEAESVAHGRITVPDVFAGRWGVVLLYRAHW
jgi:hypothetical protein